MDVLLNYKFSKPFVSQTELIELFGSLSESTLKRYMKEWIDSGNDVKDMGMFRLDKVRENQWEPVTFMKWLYENKINNTQAWLLYDDIIEGFRDAKDKQKFLINTLSKYN